MTNEEAIQVLHHIVQVADTSDCGIKEIDGIDEESLDMAIKALEQAPRTGHWIIYDVHGHKACKCSECDKDVGYPCNYKYCPYCGIRIVGSQESEE